jgi:hypothetical protein
MDEIEVSGLHSLLARCLRVVGIVCNLAASAQLELTVHVYTLVSVSSVMFRTAVPITSGRGGHCRRSEAALAVPEPIGPWRDDRAAERPARVETVACQEPGVHM